VIRAKAVGGLHEFLAEEVLGKFAGPGKRALDLGTGRGAMAERLQRMGCEVVAADLIRDDYEAQVPHVTIDFDQADFAGSLGANKFEVVTAIEVIEHVESPIGFLRNVQRLLSPGGIAILTTPNVDSLPARVKHFFSGRIRMMDEYGDPTHISPIFYELLLRQFLPRSGLQLQQHLLFPPHGFQLSRKSVAWLMGMATRWLPGETIAGDIHVLVLKARSEAGAEQARDANNSRMAKL
jgi:2-polyprenyl-3-methyl-5-hydroxy-6-metoxy-1,4-benzoquinol methylase